MVLDAVSNFVRGNTDAAIASGDTTISVADASIFPDPATDGEFNVVIWDVNNFPRPDQDVNVEIVRVTARDTGTNELTVTRAQEMTSAAAHPDGSAIHLSPTAKMFSDIEGTFADFWDADAQQLTADVNNTNTTTETLEAGALGIGDSEQIKAGPVGDENQFFPVGVLIFKGSFTTTSTDFTNLGSFGGDESSFDADLDNLANLGDLHVSISCIANVDDSNETIEIRMPNVDEVMISTSSTSGTNRQSSDIVPVDNFEPGGWLRIRPRVRVTGGEGTIQHINFRFWRPIE